MGTLDSKLFRKRTLLLSSAMSKFVVFLLDSSMFFDENSILFLIFSNIKMELKRC